MAEVGAGGLFSVYKGKNYCFNFSVMNIKIFIYYFQVKLNKTVWYFTFDVAAANQ